MIKPRWIKVVYVGVGPDAGRAARLASAFAGPETVYDRDGSVAGHIVEMEARDGELWALASLTRNVEILTMRWETL